MLPEVPAARFGPGGLASKESVILVLEVVNLLLAICRCLKADRSDERLTLCGPVLASYLVRLLKNRDLTRRNYGLRCERRAPSVGLFRYCLAVAIHRRIRICQTEVRAEECDD